MYVPYFATHKLVQPLRACSEHPFFITEEGWGEFQIHIEIFCRQYGTVKLTHYLKLNGQDEIVVNERFETICFNFPDGSTLNMSPELAGTEDALAYASPELLSIPVLSEYLTSNMGIRQYLSVEECFLDSNKPMLIEKQEHLRSLIANAIKKEEELCTVITSRAKK